MKLNSVMEEVEALRMATSSQKSEIAKLELERASSQEQIYKLQTHLTMLEAHYRSRLRRVAVYSVMLSLALFSLSIIFADQIEHIIQVSLRQALLAATWLRDGASELLN